MNRLGMIVATAAATLMAGGVQAQGYGQEDGYLPPPAYAYYGAETGAGYDYGTCASSRFTIVGAHAGVTVLGLDVGAGAAASVPIGDCHAYRHERYRSYPPQAYAPPVQYPPPVQYAPPPVQYAPPAPYGGPGYGGYSEPCGCQRSGW